MPSLATSLVTDAIILLYLLELWGMGAEGPMQVGSFLEASGDFLSVGS